MSTRLRLYSITICMLLTLFLAACEGFDQPTPTPIPTVTPRPTPTSVPTTASLPTPLAEPTATTTTSVSQQGQPTPPATQHPIISRIATGIPTAAALFDGPTPT